MRAKIWKEFVHFFGLFVCMSIGYWVAGQREPKDGWYYFVTALVVMLAALIVYLVLVYLLSFVWSRFVKKNESAN